MDIKKILEFINNNKLLTGIAVLVIVLSLMLITAPRGIEVQDPSKNVARYVTFKDFTLIEKDGQYTIEVSNPNVTDPVKIKNTFGFDADYPVKIVYLAAGRPRPENSQELPGTPVTPIPTQDLGIIGD